MKMATVYGNRRVQELREELALGIIKPHIAVRMAENLVNAGYITSIDYATIKDLAHKKEVTR